MFKWLKKQNKNMTPKKTQYDTFDDFMHMMIECSEEQFESICLWLKSMRKPKM
jgi:hypothetical protein